jgi:hypothetical protein
MKYQNIRSSVLIPVLALTIIVMQFSSCKPLPLNELQTGIDRIAARYVTDQREGIANILLEERKKGELVLYGETDSPELKQEVIDTLKGAGYIVSDSILVLPGDDLGEYKYGLVSLSVINLRKLPGHSYELVSQSLMGTPLKLLKEDGYWLLVQTPDRYISWTEKGAVQLMTESDFGKWKKSPKLICTDNLGWIYESVDEKKVIGDFVAGCIVKSAGRTGAHEKVILPDGREGYVRKRSVADYEVWKNSIIPVGDNICNAASGMMGIPYLWGGSSMKAVDCSGFVQTVYFMNGIILQRDASLQALNGLPLDISAGWQDLMAGDLLFFGSVRNSRPRVTHVAIYIGDSEYIHSSGRVMINSLDSARTNYSSYRRNSLLSARRVIGSEDYRGISHVRDHNWY